MTVLIITAVALEARAAAPLAGLPRHWGPHTDADQCLRVAEAALRRSRTDDESAAAHYWRAACRLLRCRADPARCEATHTAVRHELEHLEREHHGSLHARIVRARSWCRAPPLTSPRTGTGREVNALLEAIVATESSGRRTVVSRAGAIGLMQVLPTTAREVLDTDDERTVRTCLLDGPCNRWIGYQYLLRLQNEAWRRVYPHASPRQRTVHTLTATLVGYNAGPTRMRRFLANTGSDPLLELDTIPIRETRRYVRRIYNRLWRAEGARRGCPHAPPRFIEALVNR